MKRKIILIIALIFLFSFPVCAKEKDYEEFYKEQYELSEAEELGDYLPENAKEYMNENGLNPENPNWVNNLSSKNVFQHIWEFIKSGAAKPLAAAAGVLAVILISAAISNMDGGEAHSAAIYASALSAAAIICGPVFEVVKAAVNAMQGCAVFMGAFIPIFAVIVASSGSPITSASMSSLLLMAAQVVSFISNFVVVPLLGGYLSISLASSVSPLLSNSNIADGIKKLSFWIMSLLTTVFIGILSIQTAVNASADTLSVKTAKFIIGSSVPVAGTVLSEALTTVTASMGLLKSSIGIYGVVACAAIFLPLIVELFIWKVCLVLTAAISDLFSLPKISSLLRAVDTVMSVLSGIILLTSAMFIISLSVVVMAGKAA